MIQSFALYAQPKDEILSDSLKKIIVKADSDSSLYSAYLNLSYYYQFNTINPAKAIEYSIAANKITGKLKSKQKTGKALLCLGQAFSMDNKISQAKEALFQALSIFIDIQDSSLLAYTKAYIGITYYYQGKLDSCLYWNLEALKIETKLNNTVRIANIYSNMAIAEEITTNKRKGIEYYKNAFLLFYNMKDFSNAATTINNIGEAFVNLKQYDSALYYVKKALLIAKENKLLSQQIRSYLTIGLCYNGFGDYNLAIQFFKKIALDSETQFDSFIYSNYLLGSSQSYLGLANYEIAIKLAKKGIALKSVGKNNHYGILADYYLILSKANEGLHNNKYALVYFRKYKAYNDSLLNLKNIENMNELSSKFEFQQKQLEIDLLKKNNELKDLLIISNKRSTFVYVNSPVVFIKVCGKEG